MLALSLAAVASRTQAQTSTRVPVVGLLITHPPVTDKVVQAVRDGLQQYGYEDGRNVRLEVRTALGRLERVPELARELVRLPADVIVLVNEPALRAVRKETTSIPIVMVGFTDDPLSLGWIESYRRPGGNVTGIFNVNSVLTGKRLEMLKETLPGASRVTVFWDPAFGKNSIDKLKYAAGLLKVQLRPVEVLNPDDIAPAFRIARKTRADAVMLVWSPLFYLYRARIAALAIDYSLPTFSAMNETTEAGCLLSYGSDGYFPFERVAYFVDRLLKGTEAADLPVEQISRLKLVVNIKTAKALGITMPQSILLRADEVIR
jgi:putative ABC transport system substrate-binding protein